MAKVLISYEMDGELDAAHTLISQLKDATDSVKTQYPTVTCVSGLDYSNNGLSAFVEMEGLQANDLELALRQCVNAAGAPSFINRGSDYKLTERVLKESGHSLKRSFQSLFVGRIVVPSVATR